METKPLVAETHLSDQLRLEHFRSAIAGLYSFIKILIFVNGAACISVLAMVTNSGSDKASTVQAAIFAGQGFVLGLFLAIASMFFNVLADLMTLAADPRFKYFRSVGVIVGARKRREVRRTSIWISAISGCFMIGSFISLTTGGIYFAGYLTGYSGTR